MKEDGTDASNDRSIPQALYFKDWPGGAESTINHQPPRRQRGAGERKRLKNSHNLHGAKNLTRIVFPAVCSSQLSGVSSMAFAVAARPNTRARIFMVRSGM